MSNNRILLIKYMNFYSSLWSENSLVTCRLLKEDELKVELKKNNNSLTRAKDHYNLEHVASIW